MTSRAAPATPSVRESSRAVSRYPSSSPDTLSGFSPSLQVQPVATRPAASGWIGNLTWGKYPTVNPVIGAHGFSAYSCPIKNNEILQNGESAGAQARCRTNPSDRILVVRLTLHFAEFRY